MQKLQGYVEQGNTTVLTAGILSTTKLQGSFPLSTVTVYLRNPAAVSISTIVRSAGTVTVTVPNGTLFVVGQPVTILGVTDASFNGTFTILTVASTTITYAQGAGNASSSGGTASTPIFLAPIYSDNTVPTSKSNPFTADADGGWFFYAPDGRYDVKFSGTGITSPFTLGDFLLFDPDKQWINANSATYGATGNGVTDDTVAIQKAIDAGIAAGLPVYLPGPTYLVSSTLTITNAFGFRLFGAGPRKTQFVWNGTDAGGPVLTVSASQMCEIENFSIFGNNSSHDIGTAIWIYSRSSGGTFVSKGNIFRNLWISSNNGELVDAIRIGGNGADGTTNANNDFHTFENVVITNFTGNGVRLEGTQSYGNMFLNCEISSQSHGGLTGVTNNPGGGSGFGGGITWIGGGIASVAEAFHVGSASGGGFYIAHLDVEECGRLINVTGPAGAACKVVLDAVEFRAGQLNADGIAIDYELAGPLIIMGCKIGDSAAKSLKIKFNPGGTSPGWNFTMMGCTVETSNTTLATLFPSHPPTTLIDVTLNNDAGTPVSLGAHTIVPIGNPAGIGIIIQGATAQAAALQEWRNVAGAVLASISAAGAALFASLSTGSGAITGGTLTGTSLEVGTGAIHGGNTSILNLRQSFASDLTKFVDYAVNAFGQLTITQLNAALVLVGTSGQANIIFQNNLTYTGPAILTSGTDPLIIQPTGNKTGIGSNATPAFPLDVTGTMRSTTAVMVSPVAFASLPAAPSKGMMANINNCSHQTWGNNADGAGAFSVAVWYNGANWTVIGK